jgi:hypothetical protein
MRRILGKMEMAQAMTNEHFAFNAVIILRLGCSPAIETWKILLEYLQRRHPLLRVHMLKKKNRYWFESAGTPPIPLRVLKRQDNSHWQQVAEEELNRQFDMRTGPLIRFTYLNGTSAEEPGDMIITIQHAIMDAVSTVSLLQEILSVCQEIETQGSLKNLEGLESLPLLPPADEFYPPSFKGVRQKWNLFLFILRQMGDELRYRLRSAGKRKPLLAPTGKGKILSRQLPRALTDSLIKVSRRKRVTLNNVLTAAFIMAAHKHLYQGRPIPLRHINTSDLRPYLDPPLGPQYVGSYFAMVRITLGMKENPSVWDVAQEIKKTVYAFLKKGDKFCAHWLSFPMMSALFRFKSFRLSNTAMSFTGPLLLEKKYGKLELLDLHAFASNFVLGPEYAALARLFAGRVYWDILYLDSDMNHDQAAAMADEIRTILETAAGEES